MLHMFGIEHDFFNPKSFIIPYQILLDESSLLNEDLLNLFSYPTFVVIWCAAIGLAWMGMTATLIFPSMNK